MDRREALPALDHLPQSLNIVDEFQRLLRKAQFAQLSEAERRQVNAARSIAASPHLSCARVACQMLRRALGS